MTTNEKNLLDEPLVFILDEENKIYASVTELWLTESEKANGQMKVNYLFQLYCVTESGNHEIITEPEEYHISRLSRFIHDMVTDGLDTVILEHNLKEKRR